MQTYSLVVKDNRVGTEIILVRILLAIAGMVILLFATQQSWLINISCSVFLFVASFFVKRILQKFRIDPLLLLIFTAIVLFIATHSFIYSFALLIYIIVLRMVRKKNMVIISVEQIIIRRLFRDQTALWSSFTNVILKDGVLTLDFTNNKLLQLPVDESNAKIDETQFNDFCRECLGTANTIKIQ